MSETIIVTETETETLEITSPGVPGPTGEGVPVGGTEGQVLAKASATDFDTEWVTGGGGASAAEDVSFTPAGGVAAANVQAAIEELDSEKAAAVHAHAGEDITSGTVADARIASTIARDSEVTSAISALSTVYQPLDADLTAVAALTTTAFGRALLELANQAALLAAAGAAAAVHAHAGEDITSGTVADARIASTIARDSEVTSAISALSTVYQPLDADLTAVAALTTTAFGRALLELADAAAARAALDLEPGTDVASQSAFQAHLDDTADAHDASAISILDAANDFTATDVEGALAELQSDHEADAQNLADHLADTADAHAGTAITNTPAGGIAATTVQAAINELDSEKAATASAVMDGDTAGGVLSGTYPNPGFASDMATQAEFDAHVNDTSAAHAASAISADSATLVGTGTDVQAVLEELDNGIADHLADTSAAHAATAIAFTPAGTIAATTVQAAIEEVASEAGGGGLSPDNESVVIHMQVFA